MQKRLMEACLRLVRRRGLLFLALAGVAGTPMAAEFKAPAAETDEFHFVVLGDAQFHDPAKFNRVIDQTRRLRPAFVIQVGDLIEGYNNDLNIIASEWRRFSDQVAPLGQVPFLAVPGNHDVFNGDKKVDARLEKMFVDTWGPLYQAFTYKNSLLVSLNSDSTEGANQITGGQLSWLQDTLKASDAEHKFIFMHRPPMLLQNAKMLHELLKQHGVSHVFYGHHHHYHFFEQDGIAYTMTNAAARSAHDEEGVGSFHHLIQVAVRGPEVAVAVIDADAIRPQDVVSPQDNYDYFDLGRSLAPKKVSLKVRGERAYDMKIPLFNRSRRDVQVLVSCSSSDQRWDITPKAIPPLSLAAGAKQTLTLSAEHAADRVPESAPQCLLKVPFQKASGEWLEFDTTVTGQR